MKRSSFFRLVLGACTALAGQHTQGQTTQFQVPNACQQFILGLAKDWNASHVTLRRFERAANGQWQLTGDAWQGRLGANGLAWGLGRHPLPPGVKIKREGDAKAPAGVFTLGVACGYAAEIARSPRQPYFQVTPRDLWVEDAASPSYNQHVRLQRPASTAWELKQRMKLDDPAHSLKLFIQHNASPAKPNAGSSIFFHIWRANGTKPSSGCTTMAEPKLRTLIAWIDPAKSPAYALLPQSEYDKHRLAWRLP